MIVEAAAYLGPARVITAPTKPGYVKVTLRENEVTWARLAMAIPYSPEPGTKYC